MNEETKEAAPIEGEETDRDKGKPDRLAAGEKGFAVGLLVWGLIAFALSMELWGRMKEPKAASAAAVPVFVSALWSFLALLTVIENGKRSTPLSSVKSGVEKGKEALFYLFPKPVRVMIGFIVVYCVMLLMGVSFYLATILFLYGSMCCLTGREYGKNMGWSLLVMGFIILVFRMLFRVVFP